MDITFSEAIQQEAVRLEKPGPSFPRAISIRVQGESHRNFSSLPRKIPHAGGSTEIDWERSWLAASPPLPRWPHAPFRSAALCVVVATIGAYDTGQLGASRVLTSQFREIPQ